MLKLFFENYNNYTFRIFKSFVPHIETNKENCDYIIGDKLSYGLKDPNKINSILKEYSLYNKKVVTFLFSDYEFDLKTPNNVILFRTSTNKKIKKNNEFILPNIINLDKNYKFSPMKKTETPIIGFCGFLGETKSYRKITCDTFKNSNKIKTNFIIRDKFWGGKPHDKILINEFESNIINSHFTICNRGGGNFSLRFYQVLAKGRIPILIDTDIVLPFENEIKWKDYIFYEKTPKELLESVLSFWEKNTDKEIIERQKKCYELYVNYLSGESYGQKISKILLNFLKK